MWVQWVKRSSSASPGRNHTGSPSFSRSVHLQTTPFHFHHLQSPPNLSIHGHSISFKDVESILNADSPNYPSSPITPGRYHSLSCTPSSSPTTPFHFSFKDVPTLLDEPEPESNPTRKKSGSIFHRFRAWAARHHHHHSPPDSDNRVVVYYTSLRVVRRTHEDCRVVRSILKGYRVRLDERDLSMDGSYVEELKKIAGEGKKEKLVELLPRVYLNGKLVGGVEEIKRLHENGELKRLLSLLPREEKGVCAACGGYRYVVCQLCDGSHRVFVEKNDEFVSCHGCQVNGLVKCPCCVSVHF